MISPNDMEKAKGIQLGLQQFEQFHLSVWNDELKIWECLRCKVDFPCERMLSFMLIQSLAALSSMLPTGNMGAILGRFGGKQ
jgi:hypothetical protein